MPITIRRAEKSDCALVLSLVKALAVYEKRAHEVAADEAAIDRALFGHPPSVFCDIAENDGAPAGFAIHFLTFSTFAGWHGIYLEDLFVVPEQRGKGVGRALLRHLAQRCRAEGYDRLAWSVLSWNKPAIGFYEELGAERVDEWFSMKLKGRALAKLANGG